MSHNSNRQHHRERPKSALPSSKLNPQSTTDSSVQTSFTLPMNSIKTVRTKELFISTGSTLTTSEQNNNTPLWDTSAFKPGITKPSLLRENDGRDVPGFGPSPTVKTIYSVKPPSVPKRPTPSLGISNTLLSSPLGSNSRKSKNNEQSTKNYGHKQEVRASSVGSAQANPLRAEVNYPLKGLHVVLPSSTVGTSKAKPNLSTSGNLSLQEYGTTGSVSSFSRNLNAGQKSGSVPRSNTVPVPQSQKVLSIFSPTGSVNETDWISSGVLKREDIERSYTPRSARQSVTFSPDTVNVERENKPKKVLYLPFLIEYTNN